MKKLDLILWIAAGLLFAGLVAVVVRWHHAYSVELPAAKLKIAGLNETLERKEKEREVAQKSSEGYQAELAAINSPDRKLRPLRLPDCKINLRLSSPEPRPDEVAAGFELGEIAIDPLPDIRAGLDEYRKDAEGCVAQVNGLHFYIRGLHELSRKTR